MALDPDVISRRHLRRLVSVTTTTGQGWRGRLLLSTSFGLGMELLTADGRMTYGHTVPFSEVCAVRRIRRSELPRD
ncbi:hypothetical protein [Nocardiopsis sp. CNR-923]|uniref:hypothetical protein n=1 Tax=Nocardiopsis sp. CNR-923 TaxID=1904965 RepID=UPI00117E6540|nr:hypothetical protein [Nocardiopsis sp. CNR-923]